MVFYAERILNLSATICNQLFLLQPLAKPKYAVLTALLDNESYLIQIEK